MTAAPPQAGAPAGPPGSGGRVRRGLARVATDVTPLREVPEYRRLWAGETCSLLGTQMTLVAVPLQVYDLTHSSLAVGLVGLAALVPLIVFGLVGGALADAHDRRRLVLVTTAGLCGCSVLLAGQAAAGLGRLWVLYLLVAVQASLAAVDSPTRRTFPARLLPLAKIPAAGALQQVGMNVALTGGPLLGSAAVALAGYRTAYALDAASFLVAGYAVLRLRPMPPEGGGVTPGLRSVIAGLRFVRGHRPVLMSFLVDLNAMVFGMPRALFPALAVTHFHGGKFTAGLLYAAPAVGALAAALSGGWVGRVHRHGLAVTLAIAVWGGAIAGFGLTSVLWWGLVLLAVAGAADMVSAVFRNAILTAATPDAMRGRLNGLFIVVVVGGPRLGDLEAGAVASAFSAETSVISGGLACLAGVALLAAAVPGFLRYDSRSARAGAADP